MQPDPDFPVRSSRLLYLDALDGGRRANKAVLADQAFRDRATALPVVGQGAVLSSRDQHGSGFGPQKPSNFRCRSNR